MNEETLEWETYALERIRLRKIRQKIMFTFKGLEALMCREGILHSVKQCIEHKTQILHSVQYHEKHYTHDLVVNFIAEYRLIDNGHLIFDKDREIWRYSSNGEDCNRLLVLDVDVPGSGMRMMHLRSYVKLYDQVLRYQQEDSKESLEFINIGTCNHPYSAVKLYNYIKRFYPPK